MILLWSLGLIQSKTTEKGYLVWCCCVLLWCCCAPHEGRGWTLQLVTCATWHHALLKNNPSDVFFSQEPTSLCESWDLKMWHRHTGLCTALTWGCLTVATPSAPARMPTQRQMWSCHPSTQWGSGDATPSPGAAPACQAGPTPISPSPTRSMRILKQVSGDSACKSQPRALQGMSLPTTPP